MHRVDNDSAPVYLHKMVKKKGFCRQTRHATTPESLFEIPLIRRRTFQAKAFSVSGPTEWNNLPVYLRTITDHEQFRKKLKHTYLHKHSHMTKQLLLANCLFKFKLKFS